MLGSYTNILESRSWTMVLGSWIQDLGLVPTNLRVWRTYNMLTLYPNFKTILSLSCFSPSRPRAARNDCCSSPGLQLAWIVKCSPRINIPCFELDTNTCSYNASEMSESFITLKYVIKCSLKLQMGWHGGFVSVHDRSIWSAWPRLTVNDQNVFKYITENWIILDASKLVKFNMILNCFVKYVKIVVFVCPMWCESVAFLWFVVLFRSVSNFPT